MAGLVSSEAGSAFISCVQIPWNEIKNNLYLKKQLGDLISRQIYEIIIKHLKKTHLNSKKKLKKNL